MVYFIHHSLFSFFSLPNLYILLLCITFLSIVKFSFWDIFLFFASLSYSVFPFFFIFWNLEWGQNFNSIKMKSIFSAYSTLQIFVSIWFQDYIIWSKLLTSHRIFFLIFEVSLVNNLCVSVGGKALFLIGYMIHINIFLKMTPIETNTVFLVNWSTLDTPL